MKRRQRPHPVNLKATFGDCYKIGTDPAADTPGQTMKVKTFDRPMVTIASY